MNQQHQPGETTMTTTNPTERWWPGDTVQVTLPERKADA